MLKICRSRHQNKQQTLIFDQIPKICLAITTSTYNFCNVIRDTVKVWCCWFINISSTFCEENGIFTVKQTILWAISSLFFVISSSFQATVRFFKKHLAILGLFFVYFCLFKQTLQFLQQINVEKMSIQYTVLGFELTIFGTWVSFHNH